MRAVAVDFRGTQRFAVRRCLGAGGMGTVYEAFDRYANQAVAIKTLRRMDAQSVYQFKREFRALADLQHPNLVRLGELFCEDGRWFFTMELVEGTTFLNYVRSSDDDHDADTIVDAPRATTAPRQFVPSASFDEARLRNALSQLACAIVALHDAGRVHRDIKPSNILVTEQGRLALLDFGLITDVHGLESHTDLGIVGTAAYMAPEQAASRPVGPAADWYAMGCLLYEALTGRTPFKGPEVEILMDKQRFEPPPPRQLVSGLPADLDALCVELLRFDPEARPMGEKILARVGAERAAVAATGAAAVSTRSRAIPFVGRESELGELRAGYRLSRSQAFTIFVEGESGIGKNALVGHFLDQLASEVPSLVRLQARCYERESLPFKAFDGVVDGLSHLLRRIDSVQAASILGTDAALLARLFPVLRRVPVVAKAPSAPEITDPLELRAAAFRGLRRVLGRLAARRPVVLFLDDLQWADADSLALLQDLLASPDAPRVLTIMSLRTSSEANPALAALTSRIGATRSLVLGPLGLEESEHLAQELLASEPGSPGRDARAIAEESRGHPLFIQELVRHVAERRPSENVLVVLDDALWARITKLDKHARHVLELLAVAGAPLPSRIITIATGSMQTEATRAISLLRIANLVRTVDEAVETYHDRVREAVLAHLDEESRRAHHQTLATALESAGTAESDPRLLVRHFHAIGESARAAEYAARAASAAAAVLAFEQAAQWYRTALRLGSWDDARRSALSALLAEALAHAGRGPEAAEAFLAALPTADPALRLEYQRRAAEQFLISGHIERGRETLAGVLGETGVGMPATRTAVLASLLWQRLKLRLRGLHWKPRHESEIAPRDLTHLDVHRTVALGLGMVDSARAADFQTRSTILALRAGEPKRVCHSLAAEAAYVGALGDCKRARKLLDTARCIASETQDPFLVGFSAAASGVISFVGGEFADALASLVDGERHMRESTSLHAWEMTTARIFRTFALLQMGAARELRVELDAQLREAVRRGDRYVESTLARSCNALWLMEDAPSDACQALSSTTWVPPESGYHLQHWWHLRALVEINLYRGRAAGMLERSRGDFQRMRRSLLRRIDFIGMEHHWVVGRLLLVEEKPRLADAMRCARRLEQNGKPFARVWENLLRAGVAHRGGDVASCVTALERAIECADQAEMTLCAAAARYRLGMLLGGAQGDARVEQAFNLCVQRGIRNPQRMFDVVAPGFR